MNVPLVNLYSSPNACDPFHVAAQSYDKTRVKRTLLLSSGMFCRIAQISKSTAAKDYTYFSYPTETAYKHIHLGGPFMWIILNIDAAILVTIAVPFSFFCVIGLPETIP